MPQPGKKAMSGLALMVVITVMVVISVIVVIIFVVMTRLPRRRKSHDHRMPAKRHCIITSQAVTPVSHRRGQARVDRLAGLFGNQIGVDLRPRGGASRG